MSRKRYTERCAVDPNRLSYYLGLIATDGHLKTGDHKTSIQLALTAEDRSVVVCFATSFVEQEPTVGTYQATKDGATYGKSYCRFSAALPKFRQYCEAVGVTENKSKTLSVDFSRIPNKYYFLRGVIDGDGCVGIGTTPGCSRIRVFSASRGFIEQLRYEFGGCLCTRRDGWELEFKGRAAVELALTIPTALEGSIARKGAGLAVISQSIVGKYEKKSTLGR